MKKELPIRSKVEIAEKIGEIIQCLHRGQRSAADLLIEEVKSRSLFLEDPIQQDVLMFAESVQFQANYDPWHRINEEIQRAADRLIEDLGFTPPPNFEHLNITI